MAKINNSRPVSRLPDESTIVRALVNGSAVIVLAVLASFKYAKDGLNADIILNQIMALQNPTLFYWGQNRLLNIIPFILAPIRYPLLNLYLVLLIATLSFFICIYLIGKSSLYITNNDNTSPLYIYMVNIFIFAVIFTPDAWISLCLWHFEYSLPCILAIISYNLASSARRFGYVACISSIFVAIGINPFTLVIIFLIVSFKVVIFRRISRADICYMLISIASFAFWYVIGSMYGGYENYNTLEFTLYKDGLTALILNFTKAYLRLPYLFILVMLICLMLLCLLKKGNYEVTLSIINLKLILAAIFSICFILSFIACIRWVRMNEYNPRYLAFCIYIGIFICSVVIISALGSIKRIRILYYWLQPVLALCMIWFLWPGAFTLTGCKIYRECDSKLAAGSNFYAGDYWQIWACVSRDINRGYESHSLGYRSVSNRSNIADALERKFEAAGSADVICMGSDKATCQKQLEEFSADLHILSMSREDNSQLRIQITKRGR